MLRRPRGSDTSVAFVMWLCLPLLGAWPSVQAQSRAAGPAYSVRQAKVEKAWCTLAVPESWRRKLLIYAHGYRPEDAPLAAPLHAEALTYQALLQDGWIVATTSYRRNGEVGSEAMEDIDALRSYVVRTYGAPAVTLLLGASEGGDLVTLMAERRSADYQGALAVGALAAPDRGKAKGIGLRSAPLIPLLFLSTTDGLSGPLDYVKQASGGQVPPILWRVARPGHLNVNQHELLTAVKGLTAWVEGTRIEASKDITYVTPRSPSVEVKGKVLAVNRRFGNLTTSFTTADMDRLGIGLGDVFTLLVSGRAFQVRYVTGFGEVKNGEWLALAIRNGLGESQFEENLTLAQNGADAAATSGADVGTAVVARGPGPSPP